MVKEIILLDDYLKFFFIYLVSFRYKYIEFRVIYYYY